MERMDNTNHQDTARAICENGDLTHDYAIELARMVDARNERINELLGENERFREEIGTALYELERLERNLGMPDRGYVRNCFNGIVRMLQGALKQE